MSVSRTAQYVAFYRALETTEMRRTPLFRDPFARSLVPRSLRFAVGLSRVRTLRRVLTWYADRRAPGARTSAIGRTRFIDEIVRRSIDSGTRQLVLLGAGFDCRAHRMDLSDARVFEVDRAETQAAKREAMAALSKRSVEYVPVDFGVDDVSERLRAHGWDAARPTTFVWEGVTNYLREEDVAKILRFVGGCAAGTVLVFTYIHRGVIDHTVHFEGAELLRENVERLGEPWKFGLEPSEVGAFVSRFGLALEDDLGADEYRAKYMSGPSDLKGYAFYRIAVTRTK